MNPRCDAAVVLEIEGLSVSLPQGAERALAVQDLSLTVMAGETVCVVGESGSGKSMVANAVMGLLMQPSVRPVAGAIRLDGSNLLKLNPVQMRELRGQRIAMVFQEPMTSLNPVLRIGEQIDEVLRCHRPDMDRIERRSRVLRALTEVGLPHPEQTARSYPFRLSGGQRQRVMIAIAMVLEPRLLIADEPTTALDVTTQAQILALMKDLQRRKGMALLFITHDFGVVAQIADQVVVMQKGVVVEAGPASGVLHRPRHPYTQALLDAIPHGRTRPNTSEYQREPLLRVSGLNKIYRSAGGLFRPSHDVQAVRDFDLALQPGQTLGIVGESGSGKSTVGRCIAGLISADGGTVTLGTERLAASVRQRTLAQRAAIQMVFQDPYASLNPRHTVGHAIASGPEGLGLGHAQARRRMLDLLSRVGLPAQAADRYPHEFSGGQRQRIAIARALAMHPKLLVADEPVSALDVSVQAQVLALFEQLRQELGLTMVFITHDLRVAAQMCDQVAVMHRGTVVEYGSTADVLHSPKHPYTQELIAAATGLVTESRA